MAKSRRVASALSNGLLIVCLAALWIAFAPVNVGGQVSYVMVNGVSMEPLYHGGDLILVRQADEYQVGDIVTYHDSKMNAYVIHRIIDLEPDGYVLKGDNNSWIDGYRPTHAEIIGNAWVRLPGMAKVIQWIRTPLNAAFSAALLGGLLMVNTTTQHPHQKRKEKRAPGNTSGHFETALYALGIAGLISLALAVFAFSRPILHAADPLPYEHSGAFYYSASGTPGVYDTDVVRSGEPIFVNLTCNLDLGFLYTLAGDGVENVTGYQQFYAIITDEQSGWQRTLPLTSDTNFTGASYTSAATLDLCQVESLVAAVEQETGVRPSVYTLDIVARVSVNGTLSGQAFSDTFEPHLVFRFDNLHFYLTGNGSQTDPLQTSEARTLANPGTAENTLNLLGIKPSVRATRAFSGFALGLSLVGLLALSLVYATVTKYDPAAAIRIKYGALLVDIYDRGLETPSPVIDVTSIEDLAKLAERQNLMILHLKRDSMHYYLVQNEVATYRYAAGKSRAPEGHPR